MAVENTLTVRLVECAKTAAQWAALLTIPKRGEICLEMENQGSNEDPDLLFKMKIGDGIHTFANLNYFPVSNDIVDIIASWVEQNLDVNEFAQASYDNSSKTFSVYGIKEVDGKIVKGTNHLDLQFAEGTKIDLTSTNNILTISHETTTRTNSTGSGPGFGGSVVTGVTTDSTGHVTGVETSPLPDKPATKNVVGATATATADATASNPYLNHVEDGAVKSHHQIIGGTQIDSNSDASGNITIKHETISRTDAEETSQPTQIITEITTNNGHVTATKTVDPDDLIVGKAQDLDSPVSAKDNSMWNHRTTGGIITINEDTAKINPIKGNTLVWNQMVDTSTTSVTTTSGHKYFTIIDGVKSIITSTGSAISVTGGTDNVIDLTKMFGAGNEPSTVAEFEAMFPLPYYEYNEGELISLNPNGLKSVGFNLWDEEVLQGYYNANGIFTSELSQLCTKNFIPVLPNTTYYYKNDGKQSIGNICQYDSNKNFISRNDSSATFTTSSSTRYIKLSFGAAYGTTYNHDICINLSDTQRNGTYEPYKESTLDLSWIKSIKDSSDNLLFPNGLLKAGDVYDEVGENYAIKRVGSRAYSSADDSDSTIITDGTTTYYPLATPVTVYFDKKSLTYPVDDLGTETLLPEGVDSTTGTPLSAPFYGQFEYKSNFKDAVLDLIDTVNSYKNPVKGADNSAQTNGELASYDSDSTVHSSGFKASNATITTTGSENTTTLPTIAALISYVQNVSQNALHYQGTVASVSALPSTGTVTGDVYILSATDGEYDIGDWFIRNRANNGWDVIQGKVRVTNRATTLTPDGGTKNIANVEGTEITVIMPDMNMSEPVASGTTLEVIATLSQTNGKVSATKKTIQSATKAQQGVTQFVNDIHGSSDQTKAVTAGDAWTEFGKRNVKAVEVDVVSTIETESTTQEVIAEGLADLDARIRGIEDSIKNGFATLKVDDLHILHAFYAWLRCGDHILTAAGAPSSSLVPKDWNVEKYGAWTGIPLYVGQEYIDTTNKIAYKAVGNTAVTDWKRITNA